MTVLQNALLFCVLGCTTFSFAADIPRRALVPDNVILCDPSSGCTNETHFGRNYKVLATPRYTVKISLSHEGAYTRADISITNNTTYPLNLSPQDFRVEVLTPKPKVLLYVAPADLKDVAPPPLAPTLQATASPTLKTVSLVLASTNATPAADAANADELASAAKQQEAIDKAAAQKDLPAASISPNEVALGRVYFESDKRAKDVNVVLPIAGMVFEFPYALRR